MADEERIEKDGTTEAVQTPPPSVSDEEMSEQERRFWELFKAKKWSQIRLMLSDMNPVDAASLLSDIEEKDKLLIIFKLLNKDQAAAIFTYLDGDLHQYILESITSEDVNELMKRMFVDDAVDLLEEMPANMVRMLLSACPPDKRSIINHALKYPENSAGSLMTTELVALFENMTVADALAHVRRTGTDRETIYICYVTDPSRKLVGAVSLRKILFADNKARISSIMTTQVLSVRTLDDQEEVAHKFQEYDLNAMPVVDKEDRLVGIITIDDIIDVIEAENTEDFEKMAALHPSEDEYLKTGVFKLARNRLIWLLFLMISATFTGLVIGHYQSLLAHAAFLAAFIPMLMDTGGNCGSQASTLVIRGMAVGEIELSNVLSVLWRELRVGCVVAFVLTSINFLRMHYMGGNLKLNGTPKWEVELIVSATLFCTIILAKLIGGLLPMCAKRLHLDPALMASPMLTTIVDALTLVIFFTIANMFISL